MRFRRKFDAIVSAYTFHHFTLSEKVDLVTRLCEEHLVPGGVIVLGDIAFQNAADQAAARASLGEDWEQEEYWLADEAVAALGRAGLQARFVTVSSCAGVFAITRIP